MEGEANSIGWCHRSQKIPLIFMTIKVPVQGQVIIKYSDIKEKVNWLKHQISNLKAHFFQLVLARDVLTLNH